MLDLYINIKKERIKNGWTQTDLAKKIGYSDKSMIAKIEAGKVDLPQTKIRAFAQVFNCTESYLMGWEDIPADKSTLALEAIKDSSKFGDFLYKTTVVNKNKSNVKDNGFELSEKEMDLISQWRNADEETKNMIVRILAFAKQGGNTDVH